MKTYVLTDEVQIIGRAGEQGGITVAVDVSDWQEAYSDGVGSMRCQRPDGKYVPLTCTISDNLMLAVLPDECISRPGTYTYTANWALAGVLIQSQVYRVIIQTTGNGRDKPHDQPGTPAWATEIFVKAEQILSATDAALQASTAAEDAEAGALAAQQAAVAAKTGAETAQTGAVTAKTAAETAQTAAEAAQAAAEAAYASTSGVLDDIATAVTAGVAAVGAEGTEQTAAVASEGAAQIAAVEAKGAETIASIPQDYTALSADVGDLKSALSELNDFEGDHKTLLSLSAINYINGNPTASSTYQSTGKIRCYKIPLFSVNPYTMFIWKDGAYIGDYRFTTQGLANLPEFDTAAFAWLNNAVPGGGVTITPKGDLYAHLTTAQSDIGTLNAGLSETNGGLNDIKNDIGFLLDYRNLITSEISYTDTSSSKKLDASGNVVADTNYNNSCVIGPVPVKAGEKYSLSFLRNAVCVYKSDMTFISSLWTQSGFTIPANGAFIKFTVTKEIALYHFTGAVSNANAAELYMLKGTWTVFPVGAGNVLAEDFIVRSDNFMKNSVSGAHLSEKAVKINHLGFISSNMNLLDTVGSTANVNLVNNVPMYANYSSSGWTASDPIPVVSGATYKLPVYSGVNVKQYDANGNYVSDSSGVETFTAGANTKFVRVSADTTKYNVTVFLFENSANTALKNTFTIPALKVNTENLGADVLGNIKRSPSSIMSTLTFASDTVHVKLLGDSITHGMGSSDFSTPANEENYICDYNDNPMYRNVGVKSWASQFASYLEEKFDCTVVNNAVSGFSAVRIIDNWNTLVSADDDIIIVMIGTNDRLFFNESDLENVYRQKLVSIYNLAVADGKEIFFITPPPCAVASEYNNEVEPAVPYPMHLEDVSNIIKYVSDSIGVQCIPLYDQFMEYCAASGTTIDSLLNDGLHPNDNGYALMYRLIMVGCGFSPKRPGATW